MPRVLCQYSLLGSGACRNSNTGGFRQSSSSLIPTDVAAIRSIVMACSLCRSHHDSVIAFTLPNGCPLNAYGQNRWCLQGKVEHVNCFRPLLGINSQTFGNVSSISFFHPLRPPTISPMYRPVVLSPSSLSLFTVIWESLPSLQTT